MLLQNSNLLIRTQEVVDLVWRRRVVVNQQRVVIAMVSADRPPAIILKPLFIYPNFTFAFIDHFDTVLGPAIGRDACLHLLLDQVQVLITRHLFDPHDLIDLVMLGVDLVDFKLLHLGHLVVV